MSGRLTYSYYPGCSLESTAREYDLSVRAVASRLGIELVELPDWSCCGASSAHSADPRLAVGLAARNLDLAERAGLDMLVACPACYLRLRTAASAAREAGQPGGRVVRHLLDVVCNDVGLDRIAAQVAKPLSGLKVVCYYGCYLVRPAALVAFDDPENPRVMDGLMTVLGADVRDWSGKVDCCGGSLSLSKRAVAARLVADIVACARQTGADAIVTACPLCQVNLETRQSGGGAAKMPVMYFTEMLGLALDVPGARTWFERHLVSPQALLASRGL